MTNESMLIKHAKNMRIKDGYSVPNGWAEAEVIYEVELGSDWNENNLNKAREFKKWLALEAFPENIADYKRRIDELEEENERLQKAYILIQEQNKELALKLYDKKG